MKILFDTDPGIDDAMALLMLARDPRAELLGVTTVYGNASVDTTTANALALCEQFGIDVPVARGASRPLIKGPSPFPEAIHGRDGLGNIGISYAQARRVEAVTAPQFISQMARRYSGSLTIVAVGPLTNLALALQYDPQLVQHVPRVVAMGGVFGLNGRHGKVSPVAEANVANDPHAADQVCTASWPVTFVGLDVTHDVLFDTDYLETLGREGEIEGAFIRKITRCYEAFYNPQTGGGIYSHDASAVACALDPTAFELRRGPVRVVVQGLAAGQTIQRTKDQRAFAAAWEHSPTQSVCVAVDADRLRREFLDCFAM